MKKCPPGIICIENVTLVFIVIAIGLIFMYIWNQPSRQLQPQNQQIVIKEESREINGGWGGGGMGGGVYMRPNVAYTNQPGDVLMNPYAPPLRDERYLVPINVSTNVGAVDTTYRQVGMLTPLSGGNKDKILPLMGRPLFVSRDKWQYYTMSDQNNSIKLPISRNGRSGTTEYGVDKLYNGDTVYVEGYDQAFKITTYDNEVIKYLPFV
jgi:hypothetical protein